MLEGLYKRGVRRLFFLSDIRVITLSGGFERKNIIEVVLNILFYVKLKNV